MPSIDFDKLQKVLLAKGIIASLDEIAHDESPEAVKAKAEKAG